MILELLHSLYRRERVPIREDELEALDRDGARALNYLMSRGTRRLRERFLAIGRTLLFLALVSYMFKWSGAGLLAFVVYGAVLTVLTDGLRYGLAARWLFYSHSRAFRAGEVLTVAAEVENGSTSRPPPPLRPTQIMTLAISGTLTLVGLPLVWFTLNRLGWATWDSVFANFFLPLSMVFIGAWRLGRGLLGIQFAKGSTVGSRDLFLDSDDALDIYALALVLSLLLAPFGGSALVWVAYLVVLIRLAAVGLVWYRQRQALALLQRRIHRIHPHSSASKAGWDDEDAAAE
jgi:hypothetical protein